MFDDEIFQKCPALASLEKIAEPKPEHLRSCVLELVRLVMKQRKDIAALRDINGYPVTPIRDKDV